MAVHQKHGRQNDRDNQDQIHARHAGTAVLSATRMMALRARGLSRLEGTVARDGGMRGAGRLGGSLRSGGGKNSKSETRNPKQIRMI